MSYDDDTSEDRDQYNQQQEEIAEAMARLKSGGVEQAEVVDRPGVLVEKYMAKKEEYDSVLNAISVFREQVNEIAGQLERHYGIRVPKIGFDVGLLGVAGEFTAWDGTETPTLTDPISVSEIRTIAAMPVSSDPTNFGENVAASFSAITQFLKS